MRDGWPVFRVFVFSIFLLTGAAFSGCAASNEGQAISTGRDAAGKPAAPLKASFELAKRKVIEGRYLVIPVTADDSEEDEYSSFGGYSFTPSAWRGLGSFKSSGYYSPHRYLNLQVVDLETNTAWPLFDRQVALGPWEDSLDDDEKLRVPGCLIFAARTRDTNGDEKIDFKDAALTYVYHFESKQLRELTPTGYDTNQWELVGATMVLTLNRLNDHSRLWIYKVDPVSGQGTFAALALSPTQQEDASAAR